jgi:hypothetical protein
MLEKHRRQDDERTTALDSDSWNATFAIGIAWLLYDGFVSSVLLSQNGETLVIVGDAYHYIFDAPNAIAKTLSSNFRQFVAAEFGIFDVDLSQKITASYKLSIRPERTEEARKSAMLAGFTENLEGILVFEGALNGTRYSANHVMVSALGREYVFVVTESCRSA